jgi:16S rRNA (cytidine1402-2'-O)-methyltransferase
MSGVLFIVATPIGNLDDITLRAINTLRDVDLVAAEDTRHSQHLLTHLGLSKKMISLHEHNERQRIERMLERLSEGENIALISDAGTPLISDPGYPLVQAVIQGGFQVVPIPGVSSVITALSVAGLPTDRFCFHGFLSQKNSERLQMLESLKDSAGTQVLFESTHRIVRLLQQLDQTLPEAQLVIAKEMTKRHETFIRGTAAECHRVLEQDPVLQKGEFVVLIHPQKREVSARNGIDIDTLLPLLMQELSLKKAVSLAVQISGLKKNDLYQKALKLLDQ